MALLLTEEQTMLRDSARDFLAEQAPLSQMRKLRDSRDVDGYSRELWGKFAGMGFTGVLVPEALGGLGLVSAKIERRIVGQQFPELAPTESPSPSPSGSSPSGSPAS